MIIHAWIGVQHVIDDYIKFSFEDFNKYNFFTSNARATYIFTLFLIGDF